MPYTDYPFKELGDLPGQEAPIRHCLILASDGDKYCKVLVEGIICEVKIGYVYKTPDRCGKAKPVSRKILSTLQKEERKR